MAKYRIEQPDGWSEADGGKHHQKGAIVDISKEMAEHLNANGVKVVEVKEGK